MEVIIWGVAKGEERAQNSSGPGSGSSSSHPHPGLAWPFTCPQEALLGWGQGNLGTWFCRMPLVLLPATTWKTPGQYLPLWPTWRSPCPGEGRAVWTLFTVIWEITSALISIRAPIFLEGKVLPGPGNSPFLQEIEKWFFFFFTHFWPSLLSLLTEGRGRPTVELSPEARFSLGCGFRQVCSPFILNTLPSCLLAADPWALKRMCKPPPGS